MKDPNWYIFFFWDSLFWTDWNATKSNHLVLSNNNNNVELNVLPDKKMGLSSLFAFSNASCPHGYLQKQTNKITFQHTNLLRWINVRFKRPHQSTGLCACCNRYGDRSLANLFVCLGWVDGGWLLPDAMLRNTDGLYTQQKYSHYNNQYFYLYFNIQTWYYCVLLWHA